MATQFTPTTMNGWALIVSWAPAGWFIGGGFDGTEWSVAVIEY